MCFATFVELSRQVPVVIHIICFFRVLLSVRDLLMAMGVVPAPANKKSGKQYSGIQNRKEAVGACQLRQNRLLSIFTG